jgi:glucose-6-phosphate dehydrogenase assembly protein OpcA
MPTTYKVLGQLAPAAVTLSTAYTVPSSTSAVVSTITAANRSSAVDTIRIAVRPTGESIANKHYITYDEQLGGNVTAGYTIGISLATTDVISVYSTNGTTSFNIFGSEIA